MCLLLGNTQPSNVIPASIIGQWNSPDDEYQLAIVTNDSAYKYYKYDSYGAPDSSLVLSGDRLFVSFVFPGTTSHYRFRVYSDSLSGSVVFGSSGSVSTLLLRVK